MQDYKSLRETVMIHAILVNTQTHTDSFCPDILLAQPAELTRCSAIAERPRCRVRYSFGQKWKTGTGRQYFTYAIGLSSTTII